MKSDRRGKSLGWIAENLCGPGVVTEHSASPENDPPLGSHIVFHFQVIRGIITINYLSTYKNAGIAYYHLTMPSLLMRYSVP